MKYLQLLNFSKHKVELDSLYQFITEQSIIITDKPFNSKNIIKIDTDTDLILTLKHITLNEKIKDIYVFGSKKFNNMFVEKNMIRNIITVQDNIIVNKEIEYNKEELPYLELMYKILSDNQNFRQTRNAMTLSSFGSQIEFDLQKGLPILTTKKMFIKGIIGELLFMLSGKTNSKLLSDKGIKIWDLNTTREFLDSRNLQNYQIGDMGPMYGYLWRHFGYPYDGYSDEKYKGKGFDQLKNVINLIKTDPASRRIMMTTFDPSIVSQSVLAPCHGLLVQFYIEGDRISCKMTQRSADVLLGLPFNITSYAILLSIIAKVTNYQVGRLIISLGDTHIYSEHIDQCITQLYRLPYEFPKLNIKKEVENMNEIEYIESLVESDFEIINYKSHPAIKATMIA